MTRGYYRRVFASAVVRKVAYLLVALVIGLAASWWNTASAQDYSGCANMQLYDAYCQTDAQARQYARAVGDWQAQQDGYQGYVFSELRLDNQGENGANTGRYRSLYCRSGNCEFLGSRHYYSVQACPPGQVKDNVTGECVSNCAEAAPVSATAIVNSKSMCQGGCSYKPDLADTSTKSFCMAGEKWCAASKWKATGETCTAETPKKNFDPEKKSCITTGGGYNECVKPDGTHCVTAPASGKSLCWKNGETGERRTTDGDLAADRQKSPTQSAVPSGIEGGTSNTTTTTIGDTTYNTTVNNGGSGTGGGQTNTGGGNDGGGDGGEGEGDGKGDCAPDKDCTGAGDAGDGVGSVYDEESDTVGGKFSEFNARISNAPIANVASNFFTIPSGGACPTFQVPKTYFWEAMEFRYHCSGPLADALALGAWLLVAVAAYAAFKIGFG